MKLLQTSDWDLGRAFPAVERRADALRQARFETLGNVVQLAVREKVDAIVAVGNLLADNRVSPAVVEQMAQVLKQSPVPVYLVPGRRDPLTQDSPWRLRPDLFTGPLVLLTSDRDGLSPRAVLSRGGSVDASVRIGEHEALGGRPDLSQAGLHGWYAGTPEPTDFGQTAGQVLMVEGTRVQPVAVGTYRWLTLDCVASEARTLLEAKADSLHTLMHLSVHGAMSQAELAELKILLTHAQSWFFHLHVDSTVEATATAYRNPLLREMGAILGTADSQVGLRALSTLAGLIHESGAEELR